MNQKLSCLIAITAWSTHHAWVEATSEDAAIAEAERLWRENEDSFSYKDGGIDCVTVLECQEEPS